MEYRFINNKTSGQRSRERQTFCQWPLERQSSAQPRHTPMQQPSPAEQTQKEELQDQLLPAALDSGPWRHWPSEQLLDGHLPGLKPDTMTFNPPSYEQVLDWKPEHLKALIWHPSCEWALDCRPSCQPALDWRPS